MSLSEIQKERIEQWTGKGMNWRSTGSGLW